MTEPKPVPPPEPSIMMYPMGTVGALIGAFVGVFVMWLAARGGFYAEILIGILSGWSASLFARRSSWVVGIIAGLVTLLVGVWAEWKFYPFIKDDSFGYFVAHFHEMSGIRLLIHAVGVGGAIWLGSRR